MFSKLSILAKIQLPLFVAMVLGFMIVGATGYKTLNQFKT